MTTTEVSASAASRDSTAYRELIERTTEAGLLHGTAAILGWDQQVMMPPGGVEYRSRQLAQLARLQHEIETDPRIGDLIGACESDSALLADPISPEAVNVRELRVLYDRRTKLPPSLVAEEAKLASLGQHIWTEARRKSDFAHFRPILERIVALLRRKAECYGWAPGGEPWDALAEDYEPGCTAAQIEVIFVPLRERLRKLLGIVAGSTRRPAAALDVALPIDAQRRFVQEVSTAFGFDYTRGRLDVSTHPFCGGSHSNDVRLTTRFREHALLDALFSTMHETGHGLYEQGLPAEHVATPMASAVSLGIHESQSRMWENQVGRSKAFWRWCHPRIEKAFGAVVKGLSIDDVHAAANVISPGFIRTEADEATYNLHIMVRFEIERALMKGDLDVRDIPGVWNEKYDAYLGLEVPDDARGCLQDIHWSTAAVGYFPTYTLGNLYGAQFFEKALRDIPNLERSFERGDFAPLRAWLLEEIHRHGRRWRAAELCEVVTGEPLSAEPLIRHLEEKVRALYGL